MAYKELSFSLGIGVQPTTELEDEEVSQEILLIYRALNVLATQLDVATGSLAAQPADRYSIIPSASSREANMTRMYAYATVNFTAGELAHINSSGHLVKAQANTSHNLKAQVVILDNVIAGSYASCAMRGVHRLYTLLTPGSDYFLSTTAGAISATPPGGGSGNTVQYIGYALSPSELYLSPEVRHSVA